MSLEDKDAENKESIKQNSLFIRKTLKSIGEKLL